MGHPQAAIAALRYVPACDNFCRCELSSYLGENVINSYLGIIYQNNSPEQLCKKKTEEKWLSTWCVT